MRTLSPQQMVACPHTNTRTEYLHGVKTGDIECVDCGLVAWGPVFGVYAQARAELDSYIGR